MTIGELFAQRPMSFRIRLDDIYEDDSMEIPEGYIPGSFKLVRDGEEYLSIAGLVKTHNEDESSWTFPRLTLIRKRPKKVELEECSHEEGLTTGEKTYFIHGGWYKVAKIK